MEIGELATLLCLSIVQEEVRIDLARSCPCRAVHRRSCRAAIGHVRRHSTMSLGNIERALDTLCLFVF
jgi:hypothetical protein